MGLKTKPSSSSNKLPKGIEKLAFFFPALHLFVIVLAFLALIVDRSLFFVPLILFVIYGFPLLLFRGLSFFYPVLVGTTRIGIKEKDGSPWVVGHKLQEVFIALPVFERALILVPGAYSFWLRLWGSRIGKNVVWTPGVEVVDRTHLQIGDYAFIGNKSYLSSHLVRRKSTGLFLLIKPVEIGSKALIGYQSDLGPGTVIPEQAIIPAQSRAMLGKIIRGIHDPSASP